MKKEYLMVRSDGVVYSVANLIYGHDYDNTEESILDTLSIVEWLYNRTRFGCVKNDILDFLYCFACTRRNNQTTADFLLDYIRENPFVKLNPDFINRISDYLQDRVVYRDIIFYNNIVCLDLNQEFMRVIIEYDKDITKFTFKLSSLHFDWYDIIYRVAYDNALNSDSITIISDEEALGICTYLKISDKIMKDVPFSYILNLGTVCMLNDDPKERAEYIRLYQGEPLSACFPFIDIESISYQLNKFYNENYFAKG